MDIAAAILETALNGEKKSRIMYIAFLSFLQLKEYLEMLMDAGLLDYAKDERIYSTTESGRRFLKMYREVDSMIPRDNMLTKASYAV